MSLKESSFFKTLAVVDFIKTILVVDVAAKTQLFKGHSSF